MKAWIQLWYFPVGVSFRWHEKDNNKIPELNNQVHTLEDEINGDQESTKEENACNAEFRPSGNQGESGIRG